MKRLLFLATLLCTTITHICQPDPLIVVVLMVKNEEHVIKETLQPFVRAGIDAYCIFDTGSTDNTLHIAQEYLQQNNIQHIAIEQEPFVDFAVSRTRALSKTQEAFPQATFMLMPDAEWYMHNAEGLISFCHDHEHDTCPVYNVRITNEKLDFLTPRLIRCNKDVHFIGAVHEVPNYATREMVPRDVFFQLGTSRYGKEKSQARWKRDIELLLKESERDPHDPRTAFYIAQTYDCLGELENARIWYEKRLGMPGWDEENFIACYRLAQVYDRLDVWHLALYYYLQAYSMRPARAEPLIKLAAHYWQTQEHALCFLFARRATEIPYPEQEILFIDKELYLFDRYDLLGIASWYVGEYELGQQAVRQALKARPDAPHLLRNLAGYLEKQAGLV